MGAARAGVCMSSDPSLHACMRVVTKRAGWLFVPLADPYPRLVFPLVPVPYGYVPFLYHYHRIVGEARHRIVGQ